MTTSTLTWLDFSRDEHDRMNELIRLFSQAESRDELGIGLIRDAFSNLMFPGVSVVQTRARYLLFVPWLYRRGAELGHSGPRLARWVEREERRLVETIRRSGDVDGLIGRRAGVNVKILPSTIYWGALQTYGILRWSATSEQVTDLAGRRADREDVTTEVVDRDDGVWDSTMPSWPLGFPSVDEARLDLEPDERRWVRERVATSCDGTLLGWLATKRHVPGPTSGPWDEPWRPDVPSDIERVVHHAELFSLVMHGAAILYNVMLAERCVELDIGQGEKMVDAHRDAYVDWMAAVSARRTDLARWDVADCWALARSSSTARIDRTERFADDWIALVRTEAVTADAATSPACRLIGQRERDQKRGQARLANERLLRQWGGSSGIGRLDYRWGQVRLMLGDLIGGVDAES